MMGKSNHRLERGFGQSLRNWEKLGGPATKGTKPDAFVEMGWGRLLFGHTFEDNARMVETMIRFGYDSRDIAMYIIDPHVVLSLAPDKLFLDPSYLPALVPSLHHGSPDPQSFRDSAGLNPKRSPRDQPDLWVLSYERGGPGLYPGQAGQQAAHVYDRQGPGP